MEFKNVEEIGAKSDFWHLLTQGYLDPEEVCYNQIDAFKIIDAFQYLEKFRDFLGEAGILNEDL